MCEKKRKETLGQWQAHMQMLKDKRKAQRLLEYLINSKDDYTNNDMYVCHSQFYDIKFFL